MRDGSRLQEYAADGVEHPGVMSSTQDYRTNREADLLWAEPDSLGRYLVAVVEYGDDASVEDYANLGSHLVSAIAAAAGEYAAATGRPHTERSYRLLTSAWSAPLLAELADGTQVAAITTKLPGQGWRRVTRRPTAEELARWADRDAG